MAENFLNHKEKLNIDNIKFTNLISFLMGFSSSLLAYILSLYFKVISGTDNVGIFFLISYLIILIIFLNLHKLAQKIGKSYLFYLTFVIKIIAITALFYLPLSILGIIFLMIYIIGDAMSWVCLDIILEFFSVDKMSGRIRGVYLTIGNAGFILAPFLSFQILDIFGFKGIFFASFVIQFLIFSISLMAFRGVDHTFKRKETTIQLLKRVFKRKNIMRIYYISFVLDFFYALMVIYTPLYFLQIGYSLSQIGLVFSIILIPFVLFQYPVGILADKKTGEKEFLIFSIFIMGVATLILYLFNYKDILFLTTILFVTRVGASIIEILRDSYFYKKIDGYDLDIIDFFRTSRPVGYIIATILSSFLLLLSFDIKLIFLLIAIVSLSGLYPAFKLVDNKSERERI
ncbi:MAG: MFS transporter [Xanthomonadaceae bacterium]|nr:MFS transporter [Rhodospirillaceae bacterium]NIA17598.1 MFS transporter [Xanthomonadaceae bacterium]